MKAILLVLIVVGGVAGGAVVLAFSGLYNVAASRPHPEAVERMMDMVFERSVKRHAAGIHAPRERLVARDAIEAGHRQYREMCEPCHAGPGIERSEIGKGLYPPAPDLWLQDASAMTPGQLYWVIAHGVKNTGMPAFGRTHGEQELWELVAFVNRLPMLSAEEYMALQDAESERDARPAMQPDSDAKPTDTARTAGARADNPNAARWQHEGFKAAAAPADEVSSDRTRTHTETMGRAR